MKAALHEGHLPGILNGHSLLASACHTLPIADVITVITITVADLMFTRVITTAFVLIMGRAHVQLTVALQLCGVSPAQGIALALSCQHPLQPLQLKMLRHSA